MVNFTDVYIGLIREEFQKSLHMKRRDFIKTAAVVGMAGSGLLTGCKGAGLICDQEGTGLLSDRNKSGHDKGATGFNFNKLGTGAGLKLSFEPYELQLRHTFTVSSYSRKTTPGVQVRIDYEGFTGYGEASMPPYLGQSVKTVTDFLVEIDLSQFKDPFQLETILAYVDSLSPGDGAAKAAIDIALHDLVGKLLGQPWWRLWGLDPGKTPNTTFTIGIDTPDVVREKTKECADKFKILKVKVGLDKDRKSVV